MISVRRALWVVALAAVAPVAAVDISVSTTGGNATSGHQYGFLHEDINNSGDGGLYAELVRNRAFQASVDYPSSLDAWYPINGAHLSLKNLSQPLSKALRSSMNVASSYTTAGGQIGFYNDGYWGMDVKKQSYTGSFWVRGDYEGNFTAALTSNITGETFGSVEIESKSKANEWTEHFIELAPTEDAPNSNNTFSLTFDAEGAGDGSLDFNLISLFPPTFKGRQNGMRVDISEALEDFHPRLFRFPGGNMLEGLTNASWWDWKDSIGPLKDRPGYTGVWGYPQTNGLGLMEYLLFAEDLEMEMILAVYAGYSLDGGITPESELQPFIDTALEEIEFVVGDASTTKWGAVRASLGHPAPFPLKYVEVGNEDYLNDAGWAAYLDYRFPMFLSAIHEKYPSIQVLASGSAFDGLVISPEADTADATGGDYHTYAQPDDLVSEFDKFDNTNTTHIVGEMAATFPNGGTGFGDANNGLGDMKPFPWWQGSVAEAVSLIGYERNADRVIGAAYAPVLRNMNRDQWPVCLIEFTADPAGTTRSTSWYVWELMAAHTVEEVLPTKAAVTGGSGNTTDFGPLYYMAGRSSGGDGHVFKAAVYNSTDGADVPVSVTFGDDGAEPGAAAQLTVLTGPKGHPLAYNDPATPDVNVVSTSTSTVTADEEGAFVFQLPDLSVAVLDTSPMV